MSDPLVVLVGLGAVGAAYGARFIDAGLDLRVLADAGRRARYAETGTVVNGVDYRFPTAAPDQATPADLAVVAVKDAGLAAAVGLLDGWVGPQTVVLSLLNGIDSEETLARAFPQASVPLAISVGIDAVREDRSVRYSSLGRIVFGERAGGAATASVLRAAAILEQCGIAHRVADDMVHQLWWKFLVNVGVNQVSAVLKAPYRVFHEVGSPAREAMIAAQREVIAVANAEGIGLGEADLDAWLDVLATLGPDNFTSMAQDGIAGRPTEVDIFAGRVCALGAAHGVPTPVNRLLWQLLKAGEAVSRSSSATPR